MSWSVPCPIAPWTKLGRSRKAGITLSYVDCVAVGATIAFEVSGNPAPRECERAYAYADNAGNTTTEPSLLRAISIATSVVRLSTMTPSPSL